MTAIRAAVARVAACFHPLALMAFAERLPKNKPVPRMMIPRRS